MIPEKVHLLKRLEDNILLEVFLLCQASLLASSILSSRLGH